MSIGGAGNTVQFGIKAVADLKGVNDAARALNDLSTKGGDAGKGLASGMDQAGSKLDQARAKADALKGSLSKISAAGFIVGGAIAGGLGLAVKTFADFQHEMNAVRSVTGATGEEFQNLSDLALKIGRDTVFSSSEAASAIEELAKAGVSTKDILEGAAAGATALAAAAGEGIPAAATQIANVLNEFGLAGDQATHVADVFANVANKSAADATSFGDALTYVGGQAHALGVPLEDVGAAIAVMADQGIQGSLAGTSLGDAMIRLAKPTATAKELMAQAGIVVKDAKGNFVGLTAVINEVAKATANMGNVEKTEFLTKIFGIQGARAMNALLNTQSQAAAAAGKSWQDYQQAVGQAGTAGKQAEQRMQGLTGAFKQLGGSIELAQIQIGGKLAPVVEAVANGLLVLVNAFTKLPGPMQSVVAFSLAAAAGLALIAAVGARIIAIGLGTASTWTQVAGAFTRTAVAADEAAGSMAAAGTSAEVADAKASPLLGTLGKLARLAATGIVIAVVATIAVDAVESAKSGKASFIEKWANDAVGGIADAIRAVGGTQIADALDASVAAAQKNMSARDITLGLGLKLDQTKGTVDKAIEAGVHGTVVGRLIPDDWIPQVQHADDVIEGLGLTVAEVQKRADSAGVSFGDMLVKIADQAGVTTPQIEAYKKAQQEANKANADGVKPAQDNAAAIDDQTNSLQDQVDQQIKSKQAQDALNRAVQDTLNQQFLASGQFDEWMRPFIVGADDAQKEATKLGQQLDQSTASTINFIKGIQDAAPEIDGLQIGFGKVGDSIVDIFRKMDDLKAIDLTPAVRSALDAVSALDKVQVKIEDVEKAISQNQGDMSMWQGRIDLVTNAFGANSQQIGDWLSQLENGKITQDQFNGAINWLAQNGGFPRLDALLAQHKISQKEYNEALSAGTWLLQRSSGALQDEDAQIVQNIIDLAKYVKGHDDADGAVKKLSETQRGFLAAMNDDKVGAFLSKLQELYAIHASPEFIKQFIQDAAAADATVKAVAQDMGLIPGTKSIVVDAKTEAAQKQVKELDAQAVKDKVFKVAAETGDAVGKLKEVDGVVTDVTSNGKNVKVEVTADTREAADQFLALNRDAITKLDGRELVVYVKGDDGNYVKVRDHIINDKLPEKTSVLDLKTIDAVAKLKEVQGVIADVTADGKTVTIHADTQAAAQEFLRLNRDGLGKLHGKTVVVKVLGDDGQWKTVAEEVIKTKIPPKKIDLETIDAVGKLKEIEGVITDVTANGRVITVHADTQEAAQKFLDLNQNELAKLDGRELVVKVLGDDGQWVTVKDHIIKDTIPDKTVKVTPTIDTGAIATGAGIPLTGGNLLGNLNGISIPVTADDQTKTGTDAAKANLDQFATDAGTAGTNAGNNFSTGLSTGFQNGVNIAITAANGIIGAASSVVNGVYNYGFNGGWNFGIGVANGIAATWNAVFNAAFNVGYAAYLGNQAGMQAHSPSKLGLKGGANWGQSVAMGIRSAASDVLNAGKALGASLSGVISAPDLSPSLRAAALSADSRPRGDILAGDRSGNVSHHTTVINQTNQFNGITDTGEIIDQVNTQTYQALTRAQAAGAFGG